MFIPKIQTSYEDDMKNVGIIKHVFVEGINMNILSFLYERVIPMWKFKK